jgi:hypothetical protein
MNRLNKLAIATGIITGLTVFILTLVIYNGNYQGYSAQHWYEKSQNTEALRQADFAAITCIRGLGYTNLPNLDNYYNNLQSLGTIDPTNNYYSKYQVDSCLYGL